MSRSYRLQADYGDRCDHFMFSKSRQLLCVLCPVFCVLSCLVNVLLCFEFESSRVAFISLFRPLSSFLLFFVSCLYFFPYIFSFSLSSLPFAYPYQKRSPVHWDREAGEGELELDGELMGGVARSSRSRNESMQVMQMQCKCKRTSRDRRRKGCGS